VSGFAVVRIITFMARPRVAAGWMVYHFDDLDLRMAADGYQID
jgi:hypothetical protein